MSGILATRVSPIPPIPITPIPPPPDDTFWTVFTATEPSGEGSAFVGAGTRIIYVAANGSDANPGTQASPKLTISGGKALLRTGKPDWLLFRRGDTWTDQGFGNMSPISGLSATEPMLISAYGTGARPLFRINNTAPETIGLYNSPCNSLAFVSLDFYSYKRDPNNAAFLPTGNASEAIGFISNASSNYILIEDCKFQFFTDNIVVQGGTTILKIRRCQILDAYIKSTAHSEGAYVANIVNGTYEQCLWDKCGYNDQVGGLASATVFNRNLYIHEDCGNNQIFNGNFSSASASEGMQLRTGGTMVGNLFYQNSAGFDVGHQASEPAPTIFNATATDNVVLNSLDRAGRAGYGIVFLNAQSSGIQAHNNIIAHSEFLGEADGRAIYFDSDCGGCVVTNNIVFVWGFGILNTGAASTITPNAIDLTGANTAGYPAPNRTLGDYYASIGGPNSASALITALRGQYKGNWDPLLNTLPIVNYIRAGFGLSPLT